MMWQKAHNTGIWMPVWYADLASWGILAHHTTLTDTIFSIEASSASMLACEDWLVGKVKDGPITALRLLEYVGGMLRAASTKDCWGRPAAMCCSASVPPCFSSVTTCSYKQWVPHVAFLQCHNILALHVPTTMSPTRCLHWWATAIAANLSTIQRKLHTTFGHVQGWYARSWCTARSNPGANTSRFSVDKIVIYHSWVCCCNSDAIWHLVLAQSAMLILCHTRTYHACIYTHWDGISPIPYK